LAKSNKNSTIHFLCSGEVAKRASCNLQKFNIVYLQLLPLASSLPKDKPHKRIQKKGERLAKKNIEYLDKENEEKVGIETKKAKEIDKETRKDEQLEEQTERDDY